MNCRDHWSSCMPSWTKVPSASRRCRCSLVSLSLEGTGACSGFHLLGHWIHPSRVWSQRVRPISGDCFSPNNNYSKLWEISRCKFYRSKETWEIPLNHAVVLVNPGLKSYLLPHFPSSFKNPLNEINITSALLFLTSFSPKLFATTYLHLLIYHIVLWLELQLAFLPDWHLLEDRLLCLSM